MIPPQPDESASSSAERRVFGLLQNDPGTKDWTVLHSLGLARRRSGPFGEIDFVVIIPDEGVICVEVKGGRISCSDGVWRTTNRYGITEQLRRSPMMQAREVAFSMMEQMRRHFGSGSLARCPIGALVIFPDVPSPPASPEFERADVIDVDDLRDPISRAFQRFSVARLREFRRQPRGPVLSPADVRQLVTFLRPSFDLVVARPTVIGRSEERILALTEEQYDRLDELQGNPRCLFEGAAGTGKTLLAVEYARRAAREGASVMAVCFNRLLGEWLAGQYGACGLGRLIAGSYHALLRRFVMASRLKEEFLREEESALAQGDHQRLYDEVYPLYGALALDEHAPADVLVVDEAQDLIPKRGLEVLDRCLRGGLAHGRWAIFGDFTRQALYGLSGNPADLVHTYCSHFTTANLRTNCRNTRRIGEEIATLTGFEKLPFRLGQIDGLPVDYRYWKGAKDQRELLVKVIRDLLREGTKPDSIVVLSRKRLENSALAGVTSIEGVPVQDATSRDHESAGEQLIRFATIAAFKGLESPVVIAADIESLTDLEAESLLYVAMSRARSLLILLVKESVRPLVDSRIREAFLKSTHA